MIRVQPGAPYTVSIDEPQVSGSPTPTLSYAWRWKGQPIGTNSRFVPGFVFGATASEVAGELSCTITASNVAGVTAQTVKSPVDRVLNLPQVQRVTIRDASAPTTIVQSLPESPGGVTLRAGGPNPPDLNPVVINGGSLAYTWSVGGTVVGTGQTVTLNDESEGLVVVTVNASNADGERAASAVIPIGDAATNFDSHIAGHAPSVNYFGSGVAFANLIYSSVKDPQSLVRGLNGQGKDFFGTERFTEWTGDPYYTADGWPFRSDNGALSPTNAAHILLAWGEAERMWSLLGLSGDFEELPVATQRVNDRGELVNKADYPFPRGINGRTFTFDVSCYWEGQGTAVVGRGTIPASVSVTSVTFSGPDGDGPFGDGPRVMSRSTVSYEYGPDSTSGLIAYIIGSDATGANPLRNMIILVSNVRDKGTGELIYAGFDHTTYKPFQLYPQFIESMRHFKHLRTLPVSFHVSRPDAAMPIHEDTGLEFEWHQENHGSTFLLRTGWSREAASAPGFEKGFAALNRPTNVGFGQSLRAMIEICNKLEADIWWLHPVTTVFVGSRDEFGNITYARLRGSDLSNQEQVGEMLLDEEYVTGFTNEIEAHLKPGLKVYSEYANEVWNDAPAYVWGTRYAWTCAMRMIAPVQYGGDGGLWFADRTLGAPAVNAGVVLKGNAALAQTAFAAAAGAMLAKGVRERLGTASAREIVCVAAGQSNWLARSAGGLGQFWATMPKLFKQLDAVAHAPYRDPILVWPHNSVESDRNLVQDLVTATGAWDAYESAGMLLPPSDPASWWINSYRADGTTNLNYGNFLSWKHLALDLPLSSATDLKNNYARRFAPPQWPANQRRWNLKLITYEGGTHVIPGGNASEWAIPAKLLMYAVVLEPRNAAFYERYLETIFKNGPKGITRDPTNSTEEELYRPGRVPLGIAENAEPLHDRFTFLATTGEPSFRFGMFWSLQWWNGHANSPPADGVREAVLRGTGIPS